MTASGIISEPKQKLREMLAECASWRAFLNVGSTSAALAKTFTEYLVGDLDETRPLGIVTFNELKLKAISVGASLDLWPSDRLLMVQMFCDDPGNPKIAEGKVPVIALETGTLLLENFIGNLFVELANLSAVDDRLAISELTWHQNWVRTDPKTWPSKRSECYTYFHVGVQW